MSDATAVSVPEPPTIEMMRINLETLERIEDLIRGGLAGVSEPAMVILAGALEENSAKIENQALARASAAARRVLDRAPLPRSPAGSRHLRLL